MAADGKLTNQHIEDVASRIDVDKMEKIAQGKLQIEPEVLETIKANNTGVKQNQEIIKAWTYRRENSQHQVIVSSLRWEFGYPFWVPVDHISFINVKETL